jgi:hypothetical protein
MAPRTAKKRTVSDEHKAAMAQGRNESRAVNQYLSALESHRPKRGRKRTPESIEKRLGAIEVQLESASGVNRLALVQERLDLTSELEGMTATSDLDELEEEFVKVAGAYGSRKGISYAAWRELGIEPSVLKRAGITRRS